MENCGFISETDAKTYKATPITLSEVRVTAKQSTSKLVYQSFLDHVVEEALDILDFVHNSDNETIAKSILSFFPDTSLSDLTKVIERYKTQDTWPKTTDFTKESFEHLQEIMIASSELDDYVEYKELIYDKNFDKYE